MKSVTTVGVALIVALLGGCQDLKPASIDALEVKTMRVNGTDLAYVEEGRGETVVFVHGAMGDWRTWDSIRPYVSPHYRYVAYSYRYHYPNKWADDALSYNFNQHVSDLAAFIKALNVGRVHVVGSSYGGRVAGILTLRHPELVRSVVLGEPSLASPTSEEGKAAAAAIGKLIGRSVQAAKAGDSRQSLVYLVNTVLGSEDGWASLSSARQQRFLDNAQTMKPLWSNPTSAPVVCSELAQIKIPVLVVRGAQTLAILRFGHEALLACLPSGSQSAVIPDARHTWAPDNPPEAAKVILNFLSKQ